MVKCIVYEWSCLEMENNEVFSKLRNYNSRLTTIIGELEVLEDFEGADYSDVVSDIGYSVVMLENRRESLQRRGRRL